MCTPMTTIVVNKHTTSILHLENTVYCGFNCVYLAEYNRCYESKVIL